MLQIAEPGQSGAVLPVRMAGIDLGTTYSLIAMVSAGGSVQVLEVEGEPLLPSAVAYTKDGVVTGKRALLVANSFTSVKRAIGLTCGELNARDDLPFEVCGEPDEMAQLRIGSGTARSPEEISAQILRTLARAASAECGGVLDGVVLTVPAYFDEARRQATMRAAELAQLPVLRLLSEPTAAALAYGLDREAAGQVMIYDLGGGTFDCSILTLKEGLYEVRATAGDTCLGGDDLDFALAESALTHWQLARDEMTAADRVALLRACRTLREAVSEHEQAQLTVTVATAERTFSIDRKGMAQLAEPLLARTLGLCRRALRDADMQLKDLDELVLVGGTTRMPAVRKAVSDFFGRALQLELDPDQVVARGAALHAASVGGATAGALLVDVTPLSLGIETLGGLVETIIPRGTPIPTLQAREFTTGRDGQSSLALHVVQGERPLVDGCRSLARFRLADLPSMAAGAARIRMTFQLDESGLLRVSARELSSGVEASIETERPGALQSGELRAMLQQAEQTNVQDLREKRRRQAHEAAESLLASLDNVLQQDGEAMLSEQESSGIREAMAQLRTVLLQGEIEAIVKHTDNLAAVSDSFAHKRMDAGVQQALRGISIDELSQ